jgi:MFS transporter, ACS family, glucarate transporter
MKFDLSFKSGLMRPTRVRYIVLGFACVLSMVTYLDRVCFAYVAGYIKAEFTLTDSQKGSLFTAFALAYAAFEIPSGALGDLFGRRRTLIRIVLWWSVFTAATGLIYPNETWPWLGFAMLLSVRFLFGVGEAGAYPNIAGAFHNWFPFKERGGAKGAVWMAGRFGGGITPFVVAALIFTVVPADGGSSVVHWRHMFWIFGGIGLIWCVFFALWFRDRPEQKPSVNAAEVALIHGDEDHITPVKRVPWRHLLSSRNLWALSLMYFCSSYGWYFNITWLPDYLRDQYGVTKDSEAWGYWTTSFMTGSPLLFGAVACLFGGLLTDLFIRRTGNRKWGRRLFGILGHGSCAACYVLAVFAKTPWPFVLSIAFAAFCNDMTMGSSWATCLDVGKRYSGIVSGCMNTVGNLGGAAAGYLTGRILDHFQNPIKTEASVSVTSMVGGMSGGWDQGFGSLASMAITAQNFPQKISDAAAEGWKVNLISYGVVYVIATFLWMGVDSTKPITQD